MVPGRTHADEPVALRCSTIVFADQSVLLVYRTHADDWVLPGGRPRRGEGLAACARREVREETGLMVDPGRVAFVLEAAAPGGGQVVDIVFVSRDRARQAPVSTEDDLKPDLVPLRNLGEVMLRPPLAGHIRALASERSPSTAPYLGNLWRADPQTLQR